MASIPLLCNICPKEPEFSDISHLLTHVASKGHLSHYFKAQVRAQQDSSTRGRLDIYDRWYGRYQIQKLLAERMAAKESKDTSGRRISKKPHPCSTIGTKEKKLRSRPAATTASQQVKIPSPVKIERVIDPQLSQSLLASPCHLTASHFPQSLQHDPAARHRAYVPRMGTWQNASPSPHTGIEQLIRMASSPPRLNSGPSRDADDESDYFRFLRSPSRTAYPDPAEFAGLPTTLTPAKQAEQGKIMQSPREPSSEAESTIHVQSPVLKGVKWPGMSLFDTASLEAQRRRNQRKDESILEQMENNSAAVQQLERIYWPDGALKMERLITGNVESSPPRETTPPLISTRKQRTKSSRSVLTDLSTNGPKIGRKPRQRKINTHVSDTQFSNLQELSGKALATLGDPKSIHPRRARISHTQNLEEKSERHFKYSATNNARKRDFEIFNDDPNHLARYQQESNSDPLGTLFPPNIHGHHGTLHSHSSKSNCHRTPLANLQPSSARQVSAQSDRPQMFEEAFLHSTMDDRENIQPLQDSEGRFDYSAAPAIQQRVTQRYFSLTGNQPPQFFSAIPPQMEFGGLAEPMYHGTTLNPLNTRLHPQHFPSYNAQSHFQYPMSTCHADRTASPGQLSSSTLGSAKATR